MNKVRIDYILKTNGGYISVKYGCKRLIDFYIFLSSSLGKLVKTLVENSHKYPKNLKEEVVDKYEIINIVNEMKIILKQDRCNNDSTKDFKKDYHEEFIKKEDPLPNCIGENDLKSLKTEFPDFKWKYLTKKLAYPYEYFNCLDDYQTPVNNFQKEDFFS